MSSKLPNYLTTSPADYSKSTNLVNTISANKWRQSGNTSALSPQYYSKKPSKIPRKEQTPLLKKAQPPNSHDKIIDLLESMIDPTETQEQTITLRQSCSIFSDCGRMVKTQSKTVRVNVMPEMATSCPTLKPKVLLKTSPTTGHPLTRLMSKVGLRKGIFSTNINTDRRNAVEPNLLASKANYKQLRITVDNDEMAADLTKNTKIMRPLTVTLSLSKAFKNVSTI